MSKERIIQEDIVSITIELGNVQKRLEHMKATVGAEGETQATFSDEFKAQLSLALGGIATQLQTIHETVFPEGQ